MLCNRRTEILHSEQLFGIRLEVKVIRNWAINYKRNLFVKKKKKNLSGTLIIESNHLAPDQDRHFVGPDLGPACLQ